MSASTLRFEDVRFRAHVREHASSVFVGYADATLVVDGALPGGEPLALRIRGIEVKITQSGPRIDFKSEQGRDGEWYPLLFPKSAETRVALTNAILADRMVAACVQTVREDIANGRTKMSA